MQTLIVHSDDNKIDALKNFLKAFGISFEVAEDESSPYNPDFVAKIEESKADYKAGRYKSIKTDDLWK